MNLHIKSPCKGCPFLKTTAPNWLGGERMADILERESFHCHNTVGFNKTLKQCAGHLLLVGPTNLYLRTAQCLNVDLNLSGRERVFDTIEDAIKHHTIPGEDLSERDEDGMKIW